MAEKTLNELVMTVARRYGNATSGTATDGTTTSLIDTAGLFHPDHTWSNFYLYLSSGSNAGIERLVTDSAQASKTLSLDPALPNAVAGGDGYQVLPLQRQYFVDAINEAIARAELSWMQVKVDETISLTTAQEYSLPTDCMIVLEMFIGIPGATNVPAGWTPYTGFEVYAASAGVPKLHLRDIVKPLTIPIPTNTKIRLVYATLPNELSDGAGTMGINELDGREAISFIQEMALHLLHEQAVARNVTGEAARAHLTLAQNHLDKARMIQATKRPNYVQRRTRTRVLPRHI